eukprot:tig00021108_g18291.t1
MHLEILHDQGPVIRTSRNQAPPRPPPAERAPAGSGADYHLVVGRRYRVALCAGSPSSTPGTTPDSSSEQEPAARRVLQLHIEPAGPSTALALATPAGAEPYGVARPRICLTVGDGGVCDERFCIIPANPDPASPLAETETMRLVVGGPDGTPVGLFTVRVAPRPAPPSQKRALDERREKAAAGEEDAALIDAFQRLGRWAAEPSAPAIQTRPSSADSNSDAGTTLTADDDGGGPAARRRRPSSGGLGRRRSPPAAHLPPPFRHGSEAAREEAAQFVAAAAAALRAVASEVGARHPVDASWAAPARLVRACTDLAAALSLPEDLRLSGSPHLVEGVYAAWHDALTSAHADFFTQLADGALMAEHCWHCIAVATGPMHVLPPDLLPVGRDYVFALLDKAAEAVKPHGAAEPLLAARATARRAFGHLLFSEINEAIDLYFTAWSQVIRAAGTPSRLEADILIELAEALGRHPDRYEDVQTVYEKVRGKKGYKGVLFSAAANAAPQQLPRPAVVLTRQPPPQLYFFTGPDPADRFNEARVLRALGPPRPRRPAQPRPPSPAPPRHDNALSSLTNNTLFFGRARDTAGMLQRAVSILETLPDEYRVTADRFELTTAHACFHGGDLAGVVRHARRISAIMQRLRRHSEPQMDLFWFGRSMSSLFDACKVRPGRLSKAYTAEDFAQATSWTLALIRRFRLLPKSIAPFIEGHMTYQLAMAHMGYGAWSKALACLERAKRDLYDRFPAYFSPRQRRIVDLGKAIAACRERLGAAPAGGGGGKTDRRAHKS